MNIQPTSCPCCGQATKGVSFKVSLEFNTVICGDQALEVEPRQAELLFALRKHYPSNVHVSRLRLLVWGSKNVSDQAVRTTVYTTRRAVEKVGYTIRSSSGEGYRLAKL